MSGRRFLALYDYGSGGVWMYIRGTSRRQVAERFPELELFDEPPGWMSTADKQRIARKMTFDAAHPTGALLELVKARGRNRPLAQGTDGGATALTERELEVLRMVAESAKSQEIAERLGISASTVKKHLERIFEKLQLGESEKSLPVSAGRRAKR